MLSDTSLLHALHSDMRLHTYICVSDIRWRALYSETRLHVFFSSSPFSIHGIMSVSILVQIACVFQSTLALCVLASTKHGVCRTGESSH